MTQFGVDYANTDTIKALTVAGLTQAKAVGTRLIIPRAIFGGFTAPIRDSYWDRDKATILAAGLNRSAYIFITVPTKKAPNVPSPKEQVKAFIDYVGAELKAPVLGSPARNMVPFFDVEQESDVLSSDQYFAWILEAAIALRLYYGAWPGMYTSARVWNEVLKNHAPGKLINCPLWLAKPWLWDVGQPVRFTGMPAHPTYIPAWGNQWLIYQYAGDALGMPGFSPGAVDTNTINLVKRGATGEMVKWIQARAGKLAIDGDFGPATEARIKDVQSCYGLSADGIVGCDTLTLLTWLNPAPA
jgi:hypothetical protein